MTSSVAGPRRSSKALPKAKLEPRKGSWSLFGGLLPAWSTTAFWISAKPLHLRGMLSKSTRCTENCNACSRHWSSEWAQFCMTMPHWTSNNQCFKSWTNCSTRLASSVPFTWPLVNQLPLLQAISATFCKENASTTSRTQKTLFTSSLNPKAQIFMLQE